jgi:prepilin-type N-terminal cleavage/methylation domain-containing protein
MRLAAPARADAGFTLIEALVAMLLVSMIVISYLGIRTSALVDATQARNWRLAREIAEEKMSELMAGARETPPESGAELKMERYPGFTYKIVIGESAVSKLEGEVANSSVSDDNEASERLDWQRQRDNYRRANSRGQSATEYYDKQQQDAAQRLAEKAPSATEFEETAVAVYFPKLEPEHEGDRDALLIKARLSTLAISGLTPKQAQAIATAKGQGAGPTNGTAPAGSAPAPGGTGK